MKLCEYLGEDDAVDMFVTGAKYRHRTYTLPDKYSNTLTIKQEFTLFVFG